MTGFNGEKEANKLIAQAGIETYSQGPKMINDVMGAIIKNVVASTGICQNKKERQNERN